MVNFFIYFHLLLLIFNKAFSLQTSFEMDLLQGLDSHNSTLPLKLISHNRRFKLNDSFNEKIVHLLSKGNEINFLASLKQDLKNSGTIFSLSKGKEIYFEVQSSGRKDEIRFFYKSNGTKYAVTFPYHLADQNWHQLIISISGTRIDLYIDCNRIFRKKIYELDLSSLNNTSSWIGQRNDNQFLFRGSLRYVKLINKSYGYLLHCPQLESDCPTCGQFNNLQKAVTKLEQHLNDLTQKLLETENRLSQLSECECHKSCHLNASVYSDGEKWNQDCDKCQCRHGQVICTPNPCPLDPCTIKNDSLLFKNNCCSKCKKKCFYFGKHYNHGEKYTEDCRVCTCEDGRMSCKNTHSLCPPLNCTLDKQFKREGDCCKYCSDHDFCGDGHDCHSNATCINMRTSYTCSCNPGYDGNGKNCVDINECLEEGGKRGHLCRYNSKCVNTIGSYYCECLPGYIRKDAYHCIDYNECQFNNNTCHKNAKCINLQGSYRCKCLPGYQGDGINCEPICSKPCENGGKCTAPNTCTCPGGFQGNFCEQDVDECKLGTHKCHNNTRCINKIGWYYCECRNGFSADYDDELNELRCIDIDECSEGTHTCHPTWQCINTEGGYHCDCPSNDTNCSIHCIHNDIEHNDGESWDSDIDKCTQCSCDKGIVTCKSSSCDCKNAHVDINCCPKCDLKLCHHQDDHTLTFRSGQTWSYGCQICECKSGEIDCWDRDCPPTNCLNPTKLDGDCCPHCEDDPCDSTLPRTIFGNSVNSSISLINYSEYGCVYLARSYESGEQIAIDHDPCASCKCKNGRICCTYSSSCVINGPNFESNFLDESHSKMDSDTN